MFHALFKLDKEYTCSLSSFVKGNMVLMKRCRNDRNFRSFIVMKDYDKIYGWVSKLNGIIR